VSYQFRFAASEADLLGVRRLNHQTFAGELGQHEVTPDGLLPDRFEHKSRYRIALQGGTVVGMVSVCDQPPWSIEKRLPAPDALSALPAPLLEVRLLAIDPAHRHQMVLAGLLGGVLQYARDRAYGAIIISGIRERIGMYERFGFRALGPLSVEGPVAFAPMALRLDQVPARIWRELALYERRQARGGDS
jgi:GNAT superfamily N-acetyltransferase